MIRQHRKGIKVCVAARVAEAVVDLSDILPGMMGLAAALATKPEEHPATFHLWHREVGCTGGAVVVVDYINGVVGEMLPDASSVIINHVGSTDPFKPCSVLGPVAALPEVTTTVQSFLCPVFRVLAGTCPRAAPARTSLSSRLWSAARLEHLPGEAATQHCLACGTRPPSLR